MSTPTKSLQPLEPRGLQFELRGTQAQDGSELQDLLKWELIYEDLHTARLRLVHLFATLGAAVWLTTAWPGLKSSVWHAALFWITGIVLVATVVVAFLEWNCFARREQQLGRLLPRVAPEPPDP